MSVKHAKTNNITDWTQAQLDSIIAGNAPPAPPAGTVLNDITLPSDWNDDHTVSVDMAEINATGTPSSSTFLRGDGSWSAPTKRVVTAADATSVTPNSDNADITYQANTQSTGTLTINADGGTPTNGQSWAFKIKSTNVQTFSWNAIFKGGTVALPTASTGGTKIDYFSFIYDSVTPAWHFTGNALGF